MHIEYWKCDYCNQIIDYDEKTKYTTPEMGYPFIPKNGGGKHFHHLCLIKYYKKKDYTQEQIAELIEDAERRHEKHISKNLRKGNLTKKTFETRKATKKDREELINYFYNYYGLNNPTRSLKTLIEKLNAGEEYGDIKNVKIPYFQLKNMLMYYRKDLDKAYANKVKRNELLNSAMRIIYDIKIVINNLNDYATKVTAVYNYENNIEIDGGEELKDFSKHLEGIKKQRDKESKEEFERIETLKDFVKELVNIEEQEET